MSKRKSRISTRNIHSPFPGDFTGSLHLNVESVEDNKEVETTSIDIQRLCRMCAQPCTVATSTNLMESNAALTYQLLQNFDISIQPKDDMPSRICHLCINELQHLEELKKNVKKAQNFLRTQLKQKKKRKLNEESDSEIFDEYSDDSDVEYTPPSKKKKVPSILKKDKKVENIVHDEITSKCPFCDLSFKNFKQFTDHQDTHFNEPSTSEIECNTHDNESNTHEFESENQNNDNNIIPHMTRDGISKSLQNRKIYKVSPNYPYQCGLCPLKYNKSIKLEEHLQKHVDTFPCPFCKTVVRKISNLIVHINQHIENPDKQLCFDCKICDKHFTCNKNLNSHMRIHHNEYKKYVCSYCNISYEYKSLLTVHMEKHKLEAIDCANNEINSKISSQKLPTCGICVQSFNDYEQLRDHLQKDHISIIESVYPCGNCTTKSKNLNSLIEHILYKHIENTDEKIKFTCEICRKDFTDSNSFNLHYKNVHNGKLIHDCPFCKIIFTDIEALKDHVARSHHTTVIKRKYKKIARKPSIKKVITKTIRPIAPKINQNNLINFTKPLEYIYIPDANTLVFNKNNILDTNNVLINNEIEPEPNVVQINITDDVENELAKEKISFHSYFNNSIENGYPCGLCHLVCNNAHDFLYHLQYEIDKLKHKQIPCGYCGCMFKKIDILTSHTEDHIKFPTKKLTHQCNVCSKRFYFKKNYITHLRSHSEIKRFKCKLCDNTFKHKMTWKVHFLNTHKDYEGDENYAYIDNIQEVDDDTLDIDVEKLIVINKSSEIVNTNQEEEHFSCDICNCKYYLSQADLYGHYLDKHFDPNILKCELCIDILNTPEDLILHLENHSKIKKNIFV